MVKISRNKILVFLLLIIIFLSCQQAGGNQTFTNLHPTPRNIIYFVSDGMGYNHLLATNYFEHGQADAQLFQQPDWLHLAMATYNAISRITENGDTIYSGGYNPGLAWRDTNYVNQYYTGSAESATALSTGMKSYSTSIGIGPKGDTLTHISQVAKRLGKSTGVVTSVPFNHATPAGFAAHVDSRHSYGQIATYMLFNTQLDVIMGAGNPDFDNNGQVREANPRYFHSVELWEQFKLNDGRTVFQVGDEQFRVMDANGNGQPDAWTLIQDREDFVSMASGNTPKRVLGIAKAHSATHYGRDMAKGETKPLTQPFNENVPSLEEMTMAALNVLSKNPEGFFVMIEGGAVDWAGHDNRLGRMIEEQMDFNKAVEAAVRWVEEHSSWEETLIIVTSDHETGYLTGPDHPKEIKQAVQNRGAGNLPAAKWNSENHTNKLVPFYAKGPGTYIFKLLADERDPVRGQFIQNSEVAAAIFIMWGRPQKYPEYN
jgi:alkaline phosphatase